ncbi:cytidylyltransferase domain-containing protein [Acetivibrio saccincola]|jgi:spore coat polysaccharide biosynthesis protein SpsF|uniref:3-deoxy-manno-octulosonate cytidylyltransferase n=1 Tax=Acetivibrio saccincola TaxID=1677857 RepID=A0A2K9E469_9FIRM|nr:glycosyltransferase family protein [Acetivibrio saccincola]AUG56266.1 3-deoxy-manno-octulosonate cytidylyltransferase [Acetivibrio saccincola]
MKVSAIIQARTGSSRLPGKVLKEICGLPVLVHVINRVKQAKKVNEIIVATTDKASDEVIVDISEMENIKVFRGSEEDVLERYYKTALHFKSDIIVRITSDNPLTDHRLIDKIVENLIIHNADYSCNNMPSTYPYGLDCECFTFQVLEEAFFNAKDKYEREHVTPYIRENKELFKIVSIKGNDNYSHLRWTLDTQEDYNHIKEIFENLYHKNKYFLTEDIIQFLQENKRI